MLPTIRLGYGKGKEGESHCVMAATSLVAGEKFTEHPVCVSATITGILIWANDVLGADCEMGAHRERILGHLPWLIIGTNPWMHETAERAATIERERMLAMFKTTATQAIAATCFEVQYYANAIQQNAQSLLADPVSTAPLLNSGVTVHGPRSTTIYANQVWSGTSSPAVIGLLDWLDKVYGSEFGSLLSDKKKVQVSEFLAKLVEETLIPMYSTMPVEPGCNIDKLITHR